MYVRWQSRERSRPKFGKYNVPEVGSRTRVETNTPDVHWRATLLDNVRIKGRPTQRHIAYIVGFTESQIGIPPQQRFLWDRIAGKLDRLGNQISAKDRKRIEAAMIKKIGKPPTPKQRAKLDRHARETLGDALCNKYYGKEFGR